MNKLKVLFLLSVILFLGMSCEEETSLQGVYSYGIYGYEESGSSLGNFGIIQDYLTEKGCIITSIIFTAESESELDKQAVALFDRNKAKINIEELSSKITTGTISFTYGLAKGNKDGSDIPFLREEEYKIQK